MHEYHTWMIFADTSTHTYIESDKNSNFLVETMSLGHVQACPNHASGYYLWAYVMNMTEVGNKTTSSWIFMFISYPCTEHLLSH